MGDLISRSALLKYMETTEMSQYIDELNKGNDNYDSTPLYDYVKEMPTGCNDWIPVSERLPEDDEDVLVWFEYFRYGEYNRLYQRIGISHTFRGEWSGFVNDQSGWHQLKIIAWQPLPEPYRQEEEKDAIPYGITAEEAGKALEKLSEAIRKATTADSIELEKRNIEQNPSINFFQKRKLIKQLDEMKGAL